MHGFWWFFWSGGQQGEVPPLPVLTATLRFEYTLGEALRFTHTYSNPLEFGQP